MLAILGGCVTRDMFRISRTDDLVSKLWARMTAPSIIARPIPSLLYNEDFTPDSFELRQSFIDVNKLFFNEFASARPKILLIDFMSEIYTLGTSADGMVTMAEHTAKRSALLGVDMDKIPPFTEKRRVLMAQTLPIFLRNIISEFGTRILVHEIYQSERMLGAEGTLVEFKSEQIQTIRSANKHLREVYGIVRSEVPEVTLFKGDESKLLADPEHRWGASPFHLVADYSLSALKDCGRHIDLKL